MDNSLQEETITQPSLEILVQEEGAVPAVPKQPSPRARKLGAGGLGARLGVSAKTEAVPQPYRPTELGLTGPEIATIVDATASRNACWSLAQKAHKELLVRHAKKGLYVHIYVFRGSEILDLGSSADAEDLSHKMEVIGCASGSTQYLDTFQRVLDPRRTLPSVATLLGDTMEEDFGAFLDLARKLRDLKIKAFTFQDVFSVKNSICERAFRAMARITGGAYGILGQEGDLAAGMDVVAYTALKDKNGLAGVGAKSAFAQTLIAQLG